jgi:hypothetical protein
VRVGSDVTEYRRAPHRNEDEGYVLAELLGYDAERIARLRVDATGAAETITEGTRQ